MVQPLTLLYTILDKKSTPFVYLFLINGNPLFILFLYFVTQNVQRKKEKIKIHYRTKLARKPLIETTRLPQLQLMMATHAEKSGKNLEFWIQKSVQTLKREIELQMSLFNPSVFHVSCVECCIAQ